MPQVEVHNALGRSDMEVHAGNRHWVFEFKYAKDDREADLLLKEAQNQKVCTEIVFNEILKDLKTLSENATKIKEEADNENKYTTSALMDEYLENYSKKTWMITQMLMK